MTATTQDSTPASTLAARETPRTDEVMREAQALYSAADWTDADDISNVTHRALCMVEQHGRTLEMELSRVRAETVEECCKAMCPHCAKGAVVRFYSVGNVWAHGDAGKRPLEYCNAHAIRALTQPPAEGGKGEK